MSSETEKKPTMRRSVRMLLIGSLAVNLLVAGLVVGAAVAHWRDDDGPRRADFGLTSPLTRALDHADRRAIGKAIRKHHRQSGAPRGAPSEEYRDVVRLLRAVPLDVAAMQDILVVQRKSAGTRHQAAQVLWLRQLEQMSDAERVAYADRLDEILKRGPRGKPPKNR